MDIYNIIKFTNKRRDLTKYLLLIILFLIFFNSKYHLYIIIVIVSYIINKAYSRLNIFKQYKLALNELNFKDLKWINKDIIVKYYIALLKYRKYNEDAFENSIQNINEFLRLKSLEYNDNYSDTIQNAIYRRNKALNELLSISINVDYNLVKKLQNVCNDLKLHTDEYILKMEETYKINSHIPIRELYDPKNNPNTDVQYTNLFDIY